MTQRPPSIDENAFYVAATKHHQAGQLQQAKNHYLAILNQNPKHARAIFGMGTMAMQVGQHEKAADFIKQAIKIGPDTALMHINLGAALRHLEKPEEAITAYDRAIKLDKNNSAAFYNKGRALQELEKFADARACYERAIEISDTDADAWVNLGTVQIETGDPDLALYSFETAARLSPNTGAPYGNAATVLFDRALYEIAMVLISKAVEVEPENFAYRLQLSNFLLTSGDLERGWADFDLRFIEGEKARKYRRSEPPPYWDGEDLTGKKILVWTEQGFGEEILAAGVLSDLMETGANCVVECSPRMVPVLQNAFEDVPVHSWTNHRETVDQANPPFDFQFPALSFLKTFRPSMDSIVSRQSVVKPDSQLLVELREKYEKMAAGRRIVGVTWKSKNSKIGPSKSIPLIELEPLLTKKDVFFVNLQYGDCTEEIENVRKSLGVDIYIDESVDPSGQLAPVFAQIAAMDIVLTVSNSNAHFAGALGTPAWMMLPKGRGQLWFWFMDRDDSPWYPSLSIFRQKSLPKLDEPAWPQVIEEVSVSFQTWLDKPLVKQTKSSPSS